MPITNDGRIYIDTTTTPHKGVSIADIQTALGTGAYSDIGGLITNGNVKKWAKFKPIRSASFILNGLERSSGLYLPYYKQIGTMVEDMFNNRWINAENYDANRTPWEWERPRGFSVTPREPFRILDFNGYYANAQPFVGEADSPVIVPIGDFAASFFWHYVYDAQALAPSDILPERGLIDVTRYLGVCMFTGTGASNRKVYTLHDVGHYDDSTIHLIEGDWSPAPSGYCHVMLFISDREIELGGTEEIGEYVPILPSISTVRVQIEQFYFRNLVINAVQDGVDVDIDWSVILDNTRGTTVTVQYHYYYDDLGVETEYLPSYTETLNINAGANTGSHQRTSVHQILSKVEVIIQVVDGGIHGNAGISGYVLLNQF